MSKITFTTRVFTLGELELMSRMASADISAAIDLMVSRSEPKVTREYVCSMSENEAMEAIEALKQSVQTVTFLQNILRSQEPEP